MKATDRQRLIAETKSLLQEIVQSGELSRASTAPVANPVDTKSGTKDVNNPKKP